MLYCARKHILTRIGYNAARAIFVKQVVINGWIQNKEKSMFGNRQKMESMEKEILLLRREIVELKLQVQTLSSKLQDQNNVAHKTELVQKKPRASGSSTLINPDYSQDLTSYSLSQLLLMQVRKHADVNSISELRHNLNVISRSTWFWTAVSNLYDRYIIYTGNIRFFNELSESLSISKGQLKSKLDSSGVYKPDILHPIHKVTHSEPKPEDTDEDFVSVNCPSCKLPLVIKNSYTFPQDEVTCENCNHISYIASLLKDTEIYLKQDSTQEWIPLVTDERALIYVTSP